MKLLEKEAVGYLCAEIRVDNRSSSFSTELSTKRSAYCRQLIIR